MGVLDDINLHRTELKTDAYTTTISDLLSTYKRGDLHVNPEYQRLFRWDIERQTEYIESLLLNIPTPPLFFATNPDGKSEVIDGLQRLSTLIKFFATELFDNAQLAIEANNDAEQNNIKIGTMLCGSPLVGSLEGYTLKTLPETLVRTLRYTRIPIIVLEKESSRRARFHVFKRLNRSGSVLSEQEIRNCSARLFGNDFPEALKNIAKEKSIRQALALSSDQEKKMGVEECVLRLLANAHSPTPLQHSVIEFLDNFMEYASEGKFILDANVISRLKKTFEHLAIVFPKGQSFKFWRGGRAQGSFSANLFDIVSYGVYINIDSLAENPKLTEAKIKALHNPDVLKDFVGSGTNTKKRYNGRLALGKDWFKTTE